MPAATEHDSEPAAPAVHHDPTALAHMDDVDDEDDEQADTRNACCEFLAADCPRGFNCPHRHVPYDIQVRYRIRCSSGDACRYFHNRCCNVPFPDVAPPASSCGADVVVYLGGHSCLRDLVTQGLVVLRFDRGAAQDPYYKQKGVRVTVRGVDRVGKTVVMRLIAGAPEPYKSAAASVRGVQLTAVALGAPTGEAAATTGAAPTDPKQQKAIFMETAGLGRVAKDDRLLQRLLREAEIAELQDERPILNQRRGAELVLREDRREDAFVDHLAYKFSHVQLIVVGELTTHDQAMLLSMLERPVDAPKEIIVVHNLRHFELHDLNATDAHGNTYADRIARVFGLATVTPSETVQLEGAPEQVSFAVLCGRYNKSNNCIVRHVFLVNGECQGVRACTVYNRAVGQYLRGVIQGHVHPENFTLSDLAEYISNIADRFFMKPPAQPRMVCFYDKDASRLVAGTVKGDGRRVMDGAQSPEGAVTRRTEVDSDDAEDARHRALVDEAGERKYNVTGADEREPFADGAQPVPKFVPLKLSGVDVDSTVEWNSRMRPLQHGSRWLYELRLVLPGITPETIARLRDTFGFKSLGGAASRRSGASLRSRDAHSLRTLHIDFIAHLRRSVVTPDNDFRVGIRDMSARLAQPVRVHHWSSPTGAAPHPSAASSSDSDDSAAAADTEPYRVVVHTHYQDINTDWQPSVIYVPDSGVVTLVFEGAPPLTGES